MFYINLFNKPNLKILFISFTCFLAIIFTFHTTIEAQGSTAKTPPPPEEMETMGAFNPNHLYLDNGYGGIEHLGNGAVQISGHTRAKQFVDVVGVKLILQRWTGTAWINVTTNTHTP